MSERFFYAKDGQREGPIELSALQELALKGAIRRSDPVWKKGMQEWQKAGDVAELFADLPPDLDASSSTDGIPPNLPTSTPVDTLGLSKVQPPPTIERSVERILTSAGSGQASI